jgi:hypothetical protein
MKMSVVIMLSLATGSIAAQELTLFESIENEQESPGPVQLNQALQSSIGPAGQPVFTLKGASRFGDKYLSVLLSRDGKEIQVQWQEGTNVPVPGYENYQVTRVSGREVVLTHRGQDICLENPAVGVSCINSAASLLTLSNATPLPVAANTAQPQQANDASAIFGNGEVISAGPGGVMINANGQQVFRNPFSGELEVAEQQLSPEELEARAVRQQARRDRLSSFEPERISDDNVPAGMRRVRTPFGDRLVPIRE